MATFDAAIPVILLHEGPAFTDGTSTPIIGDVPRGDPPTRCGITLPTLQPLQPRGHRMDLTAHLSIAEYLATAHRAYVDEQLRSWRASPALWLHARRLADELFEPARLLLGVPLHVTSGYRCGPLNAAVGGRPTSRHVLALAVDVVPLGRGVREAFETLAVALRAGRLPHADELILEMGWIHMQVAAQGDARQALLQTHDGAHFAPWV